MKFNKIGLFSVYLLLFSVVLIITWLQPFIPLILLFRDTFHLAEMAPHHGLFSNIGSFLFCVTGSISLFSSALLNSVKGNKEVIRFLSVFGCISFLLTIDDFFMFHEYIAPEVLGISEKAVLGALGIIIFFSLARFRKTILKTDFKILGIALLFFFLSVCFDKFLDGQQNAIYFLKTGEKYILEDGAKLLGIATWLYYFAVVSFTQVTHPLPEHLPVRRNISG